VHFLGADLHFHRRAKRAEQGGVQGLVAIRLGNGDVILELAWNGFVQRVQGAEREVAVARAFNHDAKAVNVEDFGKCQVLFLHLAVDAVQVLFAAAYLRRNLAFEQLGFDRGLDLVDDFLAVAAGGFHRFLDHFVTVWVQMHEGDVFELLVDLVEPETVGDGGVDVQRFLGDAADFLRLHGIQRAHVMEAIGQLDQDDADIARHRQQHLAEVFGLGLRLVFELNLVQLGDAIDQLRDGLAEFSGDVFRTYPGVFHDIMEQGGNQRLRIEMPAGQDSRYRQGVRDVRCTALAELALMRGGGKLVGAHEGALIRLAEIGGCLRQHGQRIGGRHQAASRT